MIKQCCHLAYESNQKKIVKIFKVVLLNFGKRYEVDLRVIFDQWPKLYIGFEAEMDI